MNGNNETSRVACGSKEISVICIAWRRMSGIKLTHVCCNAVFLQQRLLDIAREKQSISSGEGFSRTLVKWNCRGSSVLKLTFNPVLKNSFNGFLSYAKNRELLLSGLIAIPICFK